MTNYQFPMSGRLEPRSPFKGGRITETDVLDLTEAAKFASVHAGAEITPADFLRAAGRGEITLRAIVHQTAKLERVGGGVYCNAGQPNENTAPKRSILNLPLSACSQLAATGRASWRTFDGFELMHGELMRYTIAELLPDEPDFETVTDDCRVTGNAVNALADAFIDEPAPATDTATPAPVVTASDAQLIPKNQRPDLLAPLIKKAQRDESDPFNAAVIWPKLCDMAEKRVKPFLGQTEDGLQWNDGNDDVQFLSLKMLRGRLSRQAKAAIELAKPR